VPQVLWVLQDHKAFKAIQVQLDLLEPLEQPEIPVLLDHKVYKAFKEFRAKQVRLVPKARPEIRVPLDHRAFREIQVQQALIQQYQALQVQQDPQVPRERMERPVYKAFRAKQVQLDHKAFRAKQVQLDHKAFRAIQVQQVLIQLCQDLPVLPDPQVPRAIQEPLAHKALLVIQALLVHKDLLAQMAQLAHKVLPEIRVQQVLKEFKAIQVQQDQLVLQVILAQQDHKAIQGLLDHKAYKAIQVQQDQLVIQVLLDLLVLQEQLVLKAIVLDYNMNFLPAPVVEILAQAY
jgi:hypothetical protein